MISLLNNQSVLSHHMNESYSINNEVIVYIIQVHNSIKNQFWCLNFCEMLKKLSNVYLHSHQSNIPERQMIWEDSQERGQRHMAKNLYHHKGSTVTVPISFCNLRVVSLSESMIIVAVTCKWLMQFVLCATMNYSVESFH